MTVGSWTPDSDQSAPRPVDQDVLQHFVTLSRNEQLQDLGAALEPATIDQQAYLMSLDAGSWNSAASGLDDEEIWHLMRFFTLAEEQLAGWQAGAQSPVIWLNKVLKQRGAALQRERLQWIRSHSSNRFLPNGAL
ncbi:hypothetical protein [Pseudomaricurvus sp. HS19]|uniref:hypothetical protein n=1 Tax=Pseudomaricurvus sp. HS19 TaxID=2692626 RepID=UPI00136C8853|nr:hypothetical protein [Pseudomaricurvus sp. HS19]MYM64667.1 hypothetical protein [Pseudomaricurvus sp. HS19]